MRNGKLLGGLVFLFLFIWNQVDLIGRWNINLLLLEGIEITRDIEPSRNPLLGIGIRVPIENGISKNSRVEMDTDYWNINWQLDSTFLDSWTRKFDTVQVGMLKHRHNNYLRVLGRFELIRNNPKESYKYLSELLDSSGCRFEEATHRDCYFLLNDLGDALDGFDEHEKAIEFYEMTEWFGRKEAATALLLQEGIANYNDRDFDGAKQKTLLAQNILPDAFSVLVLRSLLGDFDAITRIKSLDNPIPLLALSSDPRLERLNAHTTSLLISSNYWDQVTLERFLRVKLRWFDVHKMKYKVENEIGIWVPETSPDCAKVNSLNTYFHELQNLEPGNQIVDEYSNRARTRRAAYISNSDLNDIKIDSGEVEISVEMERWWEYGQPVGFSAALGSDNELRKSTWFWGPDISRVYEGRASFRADCLWEGTQSIVGQNEKAILFLALTDEKSGAVKEIYIPPGRKLYVSLWYGVDNGLVVNPFVLNKTSREIESSSSLISNEENNFWTHYEVEVPPKDFPESYEVRVNLIGCGTAWIDSLLVLIE